MPTFASASSPIACSPSTWSDPLAVRPVHPRPAGMSPALQVIAGYRERKIKKAIGILLAAAQGVAAEVIRCPQRQRSAHRPVNSARSCSRWRAPRPPTRRSAVMPARSITALARAGPTPGSARST